MGHFFEHHFCVQCMDNCQYSLGGTLLENTPDDLGNDWQSMLHDERASFLVTVLSYLSSEAQTKLHH